MSSIIFQNYFLYCTNPLIDQHNGLGFTESESKELESFWRTYEMNGVGHNDPLILIFENISTLSSSFCARVFKKPRDIVTSSLRTQEKVEDSHQYYFVLIMLSREIVKEIPVIMMGIFSFCINCCFKKIKLEANGLQTASSPYNNQPLKTIGVDTLE